MKIQQTIKVLIVAASITCVSYSAQAQSAGVRAAGRSGAAHSVAEQVRREANGTHCGPNSYFQQSRYEGGVTQPGYRRISTVCKHGSVRKLTLH